MSNHCSQDPKAILQKAIEELDVFTQLETSRLEVGENGRLVAAKESRLERVVALARCYIAPLFSDQIKEQQERRLLELKKAILRARDIVKSHCPLIEKFKDGDEIQRKLAESALSAIQRYNAIVAQDVPEAMKQDVYNYERQQLLLDQEIKGQQIELPYVISIKYDSHPNSHPAHKMLRELSKTLRKEIEQKNNPSNIPTHKNSLQFMIDTFQMKAIRMIEMHLKKPVAEIVPLVKRAKPEIEEDVEANLMHMQQLIEVEAGSVILVSGCFNRNATHVKFMAMPILDSFRLSFQVTHSGYPYAFQHTGWTVGDKWVGASPLREDQTPFFHQVNQRRKALAHRLLFDQSFIEQVRRYFKIKCDVFNQNRHIFIPLHQQLSQALQRCAASVEPNPITFVSHEAFFHKALNAPSAFDVIAQTQQKIVDMFIQQPMRILEEEWLEDADTPLRLGTSQEKFLAVRTKLDQHRQSIQNQLDDAHDQDVYILQQGLILGKAFQAVALQYQSEKMEFSPPLLNDFERKLQICAFQQLLSFLNECENSLDLLDVGRIKGNLLMALTKDLQLLETNNEDEHALPIIIVNELEIYFQERFRVTII